MKQYPSLFLSLSLLAACGNDKPEAAPQKVDAALREQLYRSGSRLKVRTLGSDDARTFTGFFDTKLDAPCAFVLASDSRMRCLPLPQPARLLYTDDACSKPGGLLAAECAVREGYTSIGPAQFALWCEHEVTRAYDAERATLADGLYVNDDFDSMCSAQGTEGVTAEFTMLGEELDPGLFVAAEEHVVENEDGTHQAFLMAEDGAGQLSHLLREGDRECWVTDFAEHGVGCSPVGQVWLGGAPVAYRSETCDGDPLLLLISSECNEKPPVAFTYNESEPDLLQVHEASKPFEGPTFDRHEDGSCTPREPSDVLTFYEFSSRKEPFPRLRERHAGKGRLQRVLIEDESGTLLSEAEAPLFDTELKATCSPTPTVAGDIRCVPEDHYGVERFADPACTDKIVVVQPGVTDGFWIGRGDSDCGPTPASDVRELREHYEGPVYEQAATIDGELKCLLNEDDKFEHYRLGPSLFDNLVRLEERTE